MGMKRIGTAVLWTLLLVGFGVQRPAEAQWAVHDSANLQQNVVQALRALEQIRNQVEQLEVMYTNLRRIGDPSWRDLHDYLLDLNELVQQGEALAYSLEGMFLLYRELYTGFVPMEAGIYEESYDAWVETTLDTLAATLEAVGVQAADYGPSQLQLAELQALADQAEGNLEALNVSNMMQAHVAQEVAKLNQLFAASVNAQNVYWGTQMNLDANHEASERWLINESEEEFHAYTGESGFTGVPADWPYPCFGCDR